MRDRTVCFTGHRGVRLDDDDLAHRLDSLLAALVRSGYRNFITGGARGFDTLAAIRIIELRRRIPDVTLTLYLPCKNQTRRWSRSDRRAYGVVYAMADKRIRLSDEYTGPETMFFRNSAMLASSSVCVCCYNGTRGGTAATVRQARRLKLRIVNVG